MFDTHSKWRKERRRRRERTAKRNERLRSKIRSYVSFNWCSRKINVRIYICIVCVRLYSDDRIYHRYMTEENKNKNKNKK